MQRRGRLHNGVLGVLLCCSMAAQLVGGETVAERMQRVRAEHQVTTNQPASSATSAGATKGASVFDAINANDIEVRF